jgi:diguanylate cyclase (GGDEF)-like protein
MSFTSVNRFIMIFKGFDPGVFFNRADSQVEPLRAPPPQSEPETKDTLTPLLNAEGFKQQITGQIASYKNNRTPFVILAVLIRGFKAYCNRHGEEAGIDALKQASDIIKSTIREYKDVPARIDESLFMILLPETLREEAVNCAIRLFIAFKDLENSGIPISIGIVQFERTWGTDKCVKTARLAAEKAADLAPPSLCLYDGKQNRFQSLSEVYDAT